ncbi:uncharacterized protein LOC144109957 isoform X2 [Amblyomma americanum]
MLNSVGQGCSGTTGGCLGQDISCPLVKLEFLSEEATYRGKHGAPASEYPLGGCADDRGGAANGKLCESGLNKRRRLGLEDGSLADELAPPPPLAVGMYCGSRLQGSTAPIGTAFMMSPGVEHQRCARVGRSFLTIRHNASVFHTEEWKPRGCTMYVPLTQDVMINTRSIDQLSFESDQFFLADGKGNYIGAKSGHAIHLWRYDSATKRLFISQSVLFLREQDHREVLDQLEYL